MPVSTFETHCLEGKLTFGDPFVDSGVVHSTPPGKECIIRIMRKCKDITGDEGDGEDGEDNGESIILQSR